MSSQTPEGLIAAIDSDLAWRKKELSALRFAVDESSDAEQSFMVRSAIALVYAHWEGYVKHVATCYLRFVGVRRLPHSNLAAPFAALAIRNELVGLFKSVEPVEYIANYRRFLQALGSPSSLPTDGVISTGSNLNFMCFRRILESIGIDCSHYETRKTLIDERLLAHRNKIAHGNKVWPDLVDYHELHEAVVDMLIKFQQQVTEAVVTKAYLCAGI